MESISPALTRPGRGYAGYPNQSKSTPKELNYWTSEEVCPLPEVRFPRKSSRIEALNRIDLFAQSQRDCAPKPKVAERARLPWVLSPRSHHPQRGCGLPLCQTHGEIAVHAMSPFQSAPTARRRSRPSINQLLQFSQPVKLTWGRQV